MLSENDKLWRRGGIGGSDARTIAYGTPDAWKALRDEKVHGIEPDFSDATRLLMAMGHAIEPLCIEQMEKKLGQPMLAVNVQAMSQADPYFRCTLDAEWIDNRPVQCKFHTGDKSIEDLTEYYWPQLQHEMFVTGTDKLYFGVIFGHYGRFEMEIVDRDEDFLRSYLLKAFEFKHYVETGELLSQIDAPMPKPNVVRGRDHVWPTNDNEIASLAVDWINSRTPAATFADATKAIKAAVPEDARSAKWVRNGVGIVVKVNKAGSKSIQYLVESA